MKCIFFVQFIWLQWSSKAMACGIERYIYYFCNLHHEKIHIGIIEILSINQSVRSNCRIVILASDGGGGNTATTLEHENN